MQIDIDITAKLTPDDVNNIVKDYLERQGYEVSDVKAMVTTRTVGHQMNEHQETVFNGIEAKVKKKKEKTYSQFDR